MCLRRYPAPATARPWWRTVGSCAGCAIHIEDPGRGVRARSSPTFRECPLSEVLHSQNRGERPVRLLGELCPSEFAPRRQGPDRRRSRPRDRFRVVSLAKSPTALLHLPHTLALCRTHHAGDRFHQKLPLRLLGYQLLSARRSEPVILCSPV